MHDPSHPKRTINIRRGWFGPDHEIDGRAASQALTAKENFNNNRRISRAIKIPWPGNLSSVSKFLGNLDMEYG
jgi:hypothetical protein